MDGDPAVFEQVLDACADAMMVVDYAGLILRANPAVLTVLGYSPEALRGRQVDTLLPERLRQRHAALRQRYADHPVSRALGSHDPLVALHADGNEVAIDLSLSPLKIRGVAHVLVAIRAADVGQRSNRAMRQAHYYAQLASLARLAVDLTDPQELLQRAPAIAAHAIGCDAALVYLLEPNQQKLQAVSAHGLTVGRIVGESLPCTPETGIGYVVARRDVVVISNWADERRFVTPPIALREGFKSGLGVPLFDKGKVVGVLSAGSKRPGYFAHDEILFLQAVASILATSMQRAQVEAQLRQAHKMESVGQLTGGIAHDFNNLLTVINGNLQMAQEHLQECCDQHGLEFLQSATDASRRAAELTGKLLAFSRRQHLMPKAVNLHQMLPSLVELLRRTLGEKIDIAFAVDAGLSPCLADEVQLESALLNIAINARDAMRQGGKLQITCSSFDGALAGLALANTDPTECAPVSWVKICVTDTGYGMDSEVLERAFEPFFTTKEVGRGTGLGLSSVYGFVKQSQGSVELESAPGKGTTVTILLPTVERAATPATAPSTRSERLPKGLHVLLVEDDALVRAVSERFLESLGCTVSAHACAESAWTELTDGTPFDLVMTDVELGTGMNGTELANRARELHPGLPVLLNSGYSNFLSEERRAEAANLPLLIKPFGKKELAAAMAAAMHGDE